MPTIYQILRMDVAGTPPVMELGGAPRLFTDPQLAAAFAKAMARMIGEKLCVKPVVNDEWRNREHTRVINGEYRQLPWHAAAWWAAAYPIWKDHFPHAALEKPGWIAYTKSPEDGARDKQSLLRPGAYLSKYFERHLDNYGISNRKCVEDFMRMYGPIDIKFATTEEEISKVYDRGPNTCLVGKDWRDDFHPARIYAAGDLSVAYMGDLNVKVSARTLVWQDKKIHSRVYGDIARLTTGLQRLGYMWGAPIGAKLKRIQLRPAEYKNGRIPQGCFVAPYIDKKNQQGGGHLAVVDKGDHLEIVMDNTPGSHHCSSADGVSGNYVPREDEFPQYFCERCAKKGREVNPVFVVGPDNEDGDDGQTEQWCRPCLHAHAWHCNYSGNNYTDEINRELVSGEYWHPYYAEMYAVRCEGSHKLFNQRDVRQVHFHDGKAQTLSLEYIEQKIGRIFLSDMTNRYWSLAQKAYVYSGGSYCSAAKAELKHHAFECNGCDRNWLLQLRYQVKDDNLLCPDCYKQFRLTKDLKLTDRARQRALPLIAAE